VLMAEIKGAWKEISTSELHSGQSFWAPRRRRTRCCCCCCCCCCSLREAFQTWVSFSRWRDWLQGDAQGQLVSLMVGAVVLILSGSAAWSAIGGDENADSSWEQSLWISWGLFFDPGTQTGVSADAALKVKFTALIFSVLGFLYNLTFLGIIVEWIRSSMDQWTKTRSRVWSRNHVLILGWSEKTLYLINELFEAMNSNGKRYPVVVLADREEAEMRQEITTYFYSLWEKLYFFDRRWRMLKALTLREGITHESDSLERSGASAAQDIIILSRDGDPRSADLETVRIMVALSSLRQPVRGRIFSEVQVHEVGAVLKRLHPSCQVIHARAACNHILSLLATDQLVGRCLADLCSFAAGDELYVVDKQETWLNFSDACRAFDKAVCIGVQAKEAVAGAHNTRIELAPKDTRPLTDGERILVMASCWQDVQLYMGSLWHFRSGKAEVLPTTLMPGNRSIFIKEPAAEILPPLEEFPVSSQHKTQLYAAVGWPADFGDILALLDEKVPKGTEVHVLSERTKEQRDALSKGQRELQNIVLKHYYGPRTSARMLRMLPLDKASAILILAQLRSQSADDGELEMAEDDEVGDDSLTSDSACLASLLVIADILESRDESFEGEVKAGPRQAFELVEGRGLTKEALEKKESKIICEVLDPRTEQVVARNRYLQKTAFFFRSKAYESGIFMMAMSEPAVFNTLMVLMSPSCPSLQAVPVLRFWSFPREGATSCLGRKSWREMNEVIRQHGGLLVGWKTRSQGLDWQLTPSIGKEKQINWYLDDTLIVILPPLLK
ncbi:unnamed protein product, partial [Effrenium voratum]